ncbi:MotA/TolQ/ExbB proton channel family protein [Phaeobacter sp. HS012]|uniref:MotA/TolQ/ExbB proton channel family protein n=1 Tax=Phaeobacter TaxID=302485 RepID=UPI001B36002A|nr:MULTISPECIES: MotA/TolQ/ExbB proton channel family protein [Phaeobacter]MBQ4809278.1 MotA/TolQ/ExbB proton channel family protein [Phaeobacter sp. HS012]MBQ4884016.1 MotA/TolQ/ExbB proton channel family protein [Phaeobacter sp. HS011]UWR44192.1 MotA/TolQ/ExbB proton channel family protein [Phaeobacter inhibens]UWR55497.1 MotA/TolQ/ExbB proton channel family protein [Phaeobacter inhibens]UWR95215.1 MotA/TolQ/ExbB proton channel family protein [Phaeobacter inhibens]
MTLRRPAALAALLLIPSLGMAQEAPVAPTTSAPQIITQSPATTAPAAPAGTSTPAAPVASVAPSTPDRSGTSTSATAADDLTAETTPAAANSTPLHDSSAATPAPDPEAPLSRQEMLAETASDAATQAAKFLRDGGPSIWAIAALSVITLALILWKIWRLALIGAWSRGKAGRAVAAFERGEQDTARDIVRGRRGIRSKVVASALASVCTLPEDRAREETARVAKLHLASAGTGLGALELIATIAPLLGLLGTVLGMIAAFQALQAAGSKADPALLAGGIWEALLTTAAGMAVAIPASAALTWFEAVITRIRRDVEDSATRIFVAHQPQSLKLAAE